MTDDEQAVSASGGTMRRLTEPPGTTPEVDLDALESLRREPEGLRPAGDPPYAAPGDVVHWHYGHGSDLLRVVRDDARGLVAWLPSGSQRRVPAPRDGLGARERSLAERARIARERDYDLEVRTWRGDGILRIVPTGAPWSVWLFWEDGAFEGWYVNLEMPHRRPPGGADHTHTRDLTLDLWLGADGDLWIKDEDELEAARLHGNKTNAQAASIRALADRARVELIEPRAWPLDPTWVVWRPPAGWEAPLRFED